MVTIDIVTSDGTWTHADCIRVILQAAEDKPKADGKAPGGALSVWPEGSPGKRHKIVLHYDTIRNSGWQITLAEGLAEAQAHVKLKEFRTRILSNNTIHVKRS